MEKYFIKFDYGVKPKNQAEKAARELALGIDGTLISGAGVASNLLQEIKDEISKINEANKRCADIAIYTWGSDRNASNISIGGNSNRTGVCYLRIYDVKQEI